MPGPGVRRAAWLLLAALSAACGSPSPDTPPDEAASAWHASLLDQAAEAWRERDLPRLLHILEQPRAGASPEQEERLATFESLAGALRVETEGFRRRRLALEPGAAPLDGGRQPPDLEHGEAAVVRIELENALQAELRVPARAASGSQSLWLVEVDVEDVFSDGSRSRLRVPWRQAVEQDIVLRPGEPFEFRLPELGLPVSEAQIRRVTYAGVLMVADLEQGGVSLPVRRLPLESLVLTSFPRVFRVVRDKALATLRVAAGAPADYPGHLVTASWFLARDGAPLDREAALGALIEALRSGPPRAEPAVLACLAMVAGDAAPPGRDRDAWLRWWALR